MIRLRTLALKLALNLGVGLGCLFTLARPAVAEAPDLYTAGLSRVEGLYLHRADVVAMDMLLAAAENLEDHVEWVLVERDQDRVLVRAGDGRALGSVSASGWEDLDDALRALESMVRAAGLPLGETELEVLILAGATEALDRHSRVLYGEGLQAFDKRLRGTYFGVGARIHQEGSRLILEQVFAGDPASLAGLRVGDELLSVDGQGLLGMSPSDVAGLLTGERGTQVSVNISRAVRDGAPQELEFVLTRDQVHEPNVSWKVLVGGFGYVRIDHFSELTEIYLLQGLSELEEQGALDRGLVIDLRNNTGGSMMQSAKSADAFVTGGDLVRTVGPEGGKVRGLVEHIWAEDDGNEPQIPIVVLQNHRTASGSEILAGSLRELDRAVLIGTRSYGKGTVQKVYTLRPDVRLKLTVAQYLLSGGLSIHEQRGVPADLPIGRVLFEPQGVKFIHDFQEPGGPQPLLFVQDAEHPREEMWEELAVRVLAQAVGETQRGQILDSAGQVRELVRVEEEQRLVATFAAHGVDWRAAPELGPAPKLKVEVFAQEPLRAGGATQLIARVQNLGDSPVYRVLVRLDAGDGTWTRYVLPVGFLAPGQVGQGQAEIQVPFSAVGRESSVGLTVQSDGRPELDAGVAILGYDGIPQPQVGVRLQLVQDERGERVLVRVENQAGHPLQGLRARLLVAPSSGIQLTEYEALLPSMAAESSVTLELGLELSQVTASELPMQLVLETQRFGEIASLPVVLPLSGEPVHLQAPRVQVLAPLHAPVGPLVVPVEVQDERSIDHLVIWHQGRKLSWQAGEGRRMSQDLQIELEPGRNTIVVLAEDDQGLRSWQKVYVRGVPAPVAAELTPEL